jgi:hypothetical protein
MVDGAGLSACAQRVCFRTFQDNAKDLPASLSNAKPAGSSEQDDIAAGHLISGSSA